MERRVITAWSCATRSPGAFFRFLPPLPPYLPQRLIHRQGRIGHVSLAGLGSLLVCGIDEMIMSYGCWPLISFVHVHGNLG